MGGGAWPLLAACAWRVAPATAPSCSPARLLPRSLCLADPAAMRCFRWRCFPCCCCRMRMRSIPLGWRRAPASGAQQPQQQTLLR